MEPSVGIEITIIAINETGRMDSVVLQKKKKNVWFARYNERLLNSRLNLRTKFANHCSTARRQINKKVDNEFLSQSGTRTQFCNTQRRLIPLHNSTIVVVFCQMSSFLAQSLAWNKTRVMEHSEKTKKHDAKRQLSNNYPPISTGVNCGGGKNS